MGSFVENLSNAIARFEGFQQPGSVAQRNHNPGNVRTPKSGPWPGQIGVDSGGYAIFPDDQAGFAALQSQVQTNIDRGLTLNEFFGGKLGVYNGYAPSGDKNDPGQYSTVVAGWLGIDRNAPLATISPGDFRAVPRYPRAKGPKT